MSERWLVAILGLLLLGAGGYFAGSQGGDETDLIRRDDGTRTSRPGSGEEGDENVLVDLPDRDDDGDRGARRADQVDPQLGLHFKLALRDHLGRPLRGLRCALELEMGEDERVDRRRAESDIDGELTFARLEPGAAYLLRLDDEEHYLRSELKFVGLPEMEDAFIVEVLPYAVLVGETRNELGEPVAGVIVGMEGSEIVRSRADGSFRLARIEESAQPRRLAALSGDGRMVAELEVPPIEAGSRHEGYAFPMLPSARLEGRVADFRDAGLPDVTVKVMVQGKGHQAWLPVLMAAAEQGLIGVETGKGSVFLSTTSRAEGAYGLPLPWAQGYRGIAEKEKWFCSGGWAKIDRVAEGELVRRDFRLNQGGALSGPIDWPEGIPEDGEVVVVAQLIAKKGLTRTAVMPPAETWGIDGLPAGRYRVRVSWRKANLQDIQTVFEGLAWGNPTNSPGGPVLNPGLHDIEALKRAGAMVNHLPVSGLNQAWQAGSPNLDLVLSDRNLSGLQEIRSKRINVSAGNQVIPNNIPVLSSVFVQSDSNGIEFESVELAQGSYLASGNTINFRPAMEVLLVADLEREVDVTLDASRDGLEVVLREPVLITGRVLDEIGEPAAGAQVQLWQGSPFRPNHESVTAGPDGRYEIRGWTGGDYTIEASGSEFTSKDRRQFTVWAGDRRQEDLRIDRGLSVAGVVHDENGKARAGISVFMNQGGKTTSATTDAAGRFRFAKLVRGEARIYARSGGKSGQDFSDRLEILVSGREQPARLELGPSITIEGELLDEQGLAMPNVTIEAVGRDNGSLKRSGKTDAQGRFRIPGCYPGPYRVTANIPQPKKKAKSRNKTKKIALPSQNVDLFRGDQPFISLRKR
ncbi:MAG: carboxypeptidase-like regulatory domain-containing protein [Planctomycetota bacterium]